MRGQCHTPALYPRERDSVPTVQEAGWASLRWVRKMSPPPEFDPRIAQPILAHTHGVNDVRAGIWRRMRDREASYKHKTCSRNLQLTYCTSSSCRQRTGFSERLSTYTTISNVTARCPCTVIQSRSLKSPYTDYAFLDPTSEGTCLWKIFSPLNYTYMQHKHKVLKCLYAHL